MSFLLDVDSFAACIRKVPLAHGRFLQNLGNLYLSVVAVTELEMWLVRSNTPVRHAQSYGAMMRQVVFLDVNVAIAHQAA